MLSSLLDRMTEWRWEVMDYLFAIVDAVDSTHRTHVLHKANDKKRG